MASPAPCCEKALADATARWPNRNRASDGIMGDADHQQRQSDHNLGNAFDLTHDPAHGVDCSELSRAVIKDNRVTYVIWNRQIYNWARANEGWRPYNGENPHTKHMHVSIRADARNDLSPWPWSPEEEDMANIQEIKEVVADMYRLLARGEIEGKRSTAHYPNSLAGLREYIKAVEEDMYRLLARGEIAGQRSAAHYLHSTAGLHEQLLAQERQLLALQQGLDDLKLKLAQTTPLPGPADEV